MSQAESVPDDNVFVLDDVWRLDPRLDARSPEGLVGVVSGREELPLFISSYLERMLGKLGSSPVP